MRSADEAPRLKPFVALADKLGLLAGQMVDFVVKAIDIAYEGEVAKLNAKPLTAAALAGVMRPMLAEVNMVSAPAIAKDRGITVSESRQEDSPIFDSLIRITVTTEKGQRSFAGTVMAGAPRVVEVKGMDLDAPFAARMLYVNNQDKPGFIGALGALLGDAGVNISTFNLGRIDAGDDAIAMVGVDQETVPSRNPSRPASQSADATNGLLLRAGENPRRRPAKRGEWSEKGGYDVR